MMDQLRIEPKRYRETVREYAYRILYTNIMALRMAPGSEVSEKAFSDFLHVSRTPVREAFIRLSQRGLLDVLPQRGTFVSKIDTEAIEEFRFLRVTVERAIIALACQDLGDTWRQRLETCLDEQANYVKYRNGAAFFKKDNDFHSCLYESCQKSRIWQLTEDANLDYLRARLLNLTGMKDQMEILYEQHRALLQAIGRHATAEALDIITDHIDKGGADITSLQEKFPHYFKRV